MFMIKIGGHRGFGTTDSLHAQSIKLSATKPAENTLESIIAAINSGANFIEIDAVQTADDKIAVIHNNNLADHVFNGEGGFVGEKTMAELKQLKVGPRGDGEIAELSEILALLNNFERKISLNIEIKDVKGTKQPKFNDQRPHLVQLLAEILGGYTGDVIFSSFAISDLVAIKKLLPQAKLAMLFAENGGGRAVYAKGDDNYLEFTTENINFAAKTVALNYLHPEIHSITEQTMALAAKLKLGVNSWAWLELEPANDKQAINNLISLAYKYSIDTGIITDFVPQMRELVAELTANTK